MPELRAIIIDDDPRCCQLVQDLLAMSEFPVMVVASYTNPLEAVEERPWNTANLLFLDVEMPQMTGFEVIDFINNDALQIVMATGHEEFAMPALKRDVCDYLLKPVNRDDLRDSLKRVVKRLQKLPEQSFSQPDRVTIPTANGFSVVDIGNIKRLESTNNYTFLYFQHENQPLLVSKPLRSFEKMLPPQQFVRINQSNIVNIDHVDRFDRASGGTVTLKNSDDEFLLGRVYRDRFMQFFNTRWS